MTEPRIIAAGVALTSVNVGLMAYGSGLRLWLRILLVIVATSIYSFAVLWRLVPHQRQAGTRAATSAHDDGRLQHGGESDQVRLPSHADLGEDAKQVRLQRARRDAEGDG